MAGLNPSGYLTQYGTAAPAVLSCAYFPLKQHKRALGQHRSSLSDHLLVCASFLKEKRKSSKKKKKRDADSQLTAI